MSIVLPPLPPPQRPQGAQYEHEHQDDAESSLVLTLWKNFKGWLKPQEPEQRAPVVPQSAEALEPLDLKFEALERVSGEDEPTTRMDPVQDLAAVLERLEAERPGPLVSALGAVHAAVAADLQTSVQAERELVVVEETLRTLWVCTDDAEVIDAVVAVLTRQGKTLRKARRERRAALVAAAAYVAELR